MTASSNPALGPAQQNSGNSPTGQTGAAQQPTASSPANFGARFGDGRKPALRQQ